MITKVCCIELVIIISNPGTSTICDSCGVRRDPGNSSIGCLWHSSPERRYAEQIARLHYCDWNYSCDNGNCVDKVNRHPCAPLLCWTCSCSVAGIVHALLLGMFMLFSRQLCSWSLIAVSRFCGTILLALPFVLCSAYGVSRNWCEDLAKNGVTAKRSERVRTCRQRHLALQS